MSIVGTYPYDTKPNGYQQLAVSSTAVALTVPAGTTRAVCKVATNAIRYRDDGVNPTATVGYPVAANGELELHGTEQLSAFKAIRQSSDATLDILYYK